MTDGWVLGRVFLILESGLCKDGRETRRQVVSHVGQAGKQVTPPSSSASVCRCQDSPGPQQGGRRVPPHKPQGRKKSLPKAGWLPGGSDAGLAHLERGKERQAGARHHPVTKSESWKHLSISRKLEKALEIFSSEYLALRCSFSGVFPIL